MAFLKPTGVERPEDISRWVCDSEVRAPMAVQLDEVAVVLRADGVERLGAAGQAERVDLEEELAGPHHPLVDPEGVVHVRVVDEALPAEGGAGLLEVDPHDQHHGPGHLVGQGP